jgi:hypothetical protein
VALEVEGIKVFAKRVRLTDLERRPENQMSTANIFGLPAFFQRNVGSVGFGVWRELAAHAMTTGWVLSQRTESFPLMYHWRQLDGAAAPRAAPLPYGLADIDAMVSYWDGGEALRTRLQALAGATASVMIFLEFVPWTLSGWLERQLNAGLEALEAACTMVERCVMVDVPLMNSLGLVHGDAHFRNLLTDGRRVYFADLGLATSKRFALSIEEQHYLHHHVSLDRGYIRAKWVNWLVQACCPAVSSPQERMELVRAIAQGRAAGVLAELPATVAESIRRHAQVATAINDFYVQLHCTCRSAPFPREDVEALLLAETEQ